MADIYGSGNVSFNVRNAAEAAAMGNPVEALKQLAMGGSINLSGADFVETVQHLHTLAIIEIAEN